MRPSSYPAASVLIVDDNPGSAKTLSFVLAAEGYDAECVATAAEALAKVDQRVFDAALIDITLPDRSGLDVLSDLKARAAEMVSIMVTGHASTENSIEAINRGASGYVRKPVEVQQLLSLLRSGLERKWLQEENARMLRRLSLLHSVEATVSQGLDPDVTLAETIALVTGLLDFEAGAIWRVREADRELRLAASVGLSRDLMECCRRHLAGLAAEIRVAPEVGQRPWFDVVEETADDGPVWFLRLMPLRGQKGITGWMAVGATDVQPSQAEEAEVLGALAGQVGVAMENMKLYEDLRAAHGRLQEAQDQLVQSEKLSSLGRFISGIAHEINNPLSAIVGYSELLAGEEPVEDAQELARRIAAQAQRCARIVRSVLVFARADEAGTQAVSLNDVLEQAVEGTEHERAEDTRVELALDPALPQVTGDADGIKQVFVNILCNAYQSVAEQGGGTVTATTSTSDGGVLVEIADTGPGIPDEALPRVFDPFFTTKGVGKGTGLGLSVAHGIVVAHGGRIWADNRPRSGARLSVWLPLGPAAALRPGEPGPAAVAQAAAGRPGAVA
jgi:signal transduction histidine kinase